MTYYYTARDAFYTDNITRTDIAINYSFFINLLGGQLEAFVQPEVINIFNEQGAVNVNTTTLTSRNSDDLVPFNPFTETPVQGVNWDYGPSFGEPQQAADYQQPRTFRVSFGLRF